MGNIFYLTIIYPLTQIIELVFSFCKKLFDSTPISLVGVSLAVSFLTLPLYIVAEHWMQLEREKQKQMKPNVDRIKAVFHGNEQYMILQTYYRQQQYHPIMSLRSAFGLLIQIPFFTAAYICLSNMTALQGSSFLFIKDLSAPDAIFSIGNFNIHILPLLMTAINIISGAIYTKGLGARDKIQIYGLALFFVAILYNSPSGLVLYWTMNNLFGLIKNIFYKLKQPIKTLYILSCIVITILIIWLFSGKLNPKRTILVAACFSIIYFIPLFVKLANFLIDNIFTFLRTSFKKRTILFLLSLASLCLLLGRLIPTLLISSSPMEFSGIDGYKSPMFFVTNTFVQSIGLCIIWPCLIYFLFNERIQTLLSFGFFSILLCSLVNAFIFQGNYGSLSTLLIFTDVSNVDAPIKMIALNLLVMIAIFTLVAFLLSINIKTATIFSYLAGICAVSILCVSIVNSITIRKGYDEYVNLTKDDETNENEIPTIFHFSKTGKNVVFIYLDRAQNKYLEPIFEECPELYKQFSGFTLYKNTVSFNTHTLLGAPACFGGYEYTPEAINKRKDISLVEKQNQSLLLIPRLFSEQANNFSVTTTDPTWANYNWIPDISIYNDYDKINAYKTEKVYLDKWYKEHKESAQLTVTSDTLKRNMLWYGLFRLSPLALRPAFYNEGKYWSTNATNLDFDKYLSSYSVLEYLPEFTDFNSETENAYINLTNNTTHESIFLQAPQYTPISEVTNFGNSPYKNDRSFHGMAGAMKRIGEWFELLQNEGVYDNCRIVIVADHGSGGKLIDYNNWNINEINPEKFHPLLMMKDFGERGELQLNYDFMTNADCAYLLTKDIIKNPTNPFTEKPISNDEKKDGALICTSDIFMPHHTTNKYFFTAKNDEWYRVKDNVFDSKNWIKEIQN
ncbi:MAG: hypothetical protein HDR51_08590 [Treponema sp.]|nr:hypothetical protein [Treponema sp.]